MPYATMVFGLLEPEKTTAQDENGKDGGDAEAGKQTEPLGYKGRKFG